MRKRVFGRKFKRTKNQRRELFRSLMNALIFEGRIKTTDAKAKSIKSEVEKLVTKAKAGVDSRRLIVARLANEAAADKMISEIGPKFITRPGGYTRILKLGPRLKDNAEIVEMSWVEEISKTIRTAVKRKTLKKSETKGTKTAVKAEKPKKEVKKETKKTAVKKTK